MENKKINTRVLTGGQKLMIILWLSFVMAAIATGVFFSAINPEALKPCVTFPEVSALGAYTIGFILFWLLTATSSILTTFFLRQP